MGGYHSQRGFTFVELLVVIAILTILFGLTALALNGVGDDAESGSAKEEAALVGTVIDVYLAMDASDTVAASDNGCTTVLRKR